jgi:gamma-glutamyl:cysteine ligase YbdK (ATP-grasp superfamily)
MVSNAAFYIGLAEYYRDKMDDLMPSLPFHLAEFNFYRAAQFGLDARIVWPESQRSGCRDTPILDVLADSVAHAEIGLRKLGIHQEEISKYLSVIQARLAKRQTGATWQRNRVAFYHEKQGLSAKVARQRMLEDYVGYSLDNIPVSEWPLK